jgi:outer membrane protein
MYLEKIYPRNRLTGTLMNRRLFALIFFSLGLIVSPMRAQQQITLDDAVRIAVENNRALKIAELETQKADYQVKEAYGLAMPNISASADYARAIKKPVFFLPASFMDPDATGVAAIEVGSNHALTMGFQATQTLFNAAVFTGVGTAKIYQKASREMRQASYQKTVADAKRAFYQVLFITDVLKLTRASFQNAQDNLKNVKIFNEQGIVSDYDLIRADVQTENIRPMLTKAESNVVLSENALKMVMGIDPGQNITVAGEMGYVPVDQSLLERSELILLANNANLKALDYQMQVNDEIADIFRAEYLPTVTAYGNYTWQGQNDKLGDVTNDLVSSSQIGLNISLSLFNGFQTTAKVDAAKIEYMKSEEQLHSTRDAMITQLQNIRYMLDEASKRVESQGKTVQQAEKGYKIATTRYSSGSGTQLEVNDADLALMQARVNRAQAIYDYNIAKADLEEILNIQE